MSGGNQSIAMTEMASSELLSFLFHVVILKTSQTYFNSLFVDHANKIHMSASYATLYVSEISILLAL